jgi:exopolysaccharide biosynthesis protein
MMSRLAWLAAPVAAAAFSLPHSTLAVRSGDAWRVWWDARNAPARWNASDTGRLGRISWRAGVNGVEWSEIVLAGSGEAWRTRVIVARLDPTKVKLQLDTAFGGDRRPAWTIEHSRKQEVFAVNAGQFLQTMPWGQVVLDGNEWMGAGSGPLASTVQIDAKGDVSLRHGAGARGAAWAFQSYPTLLRAGEVPPELRGDAEGIDLEHRDARAAIGVAADGKVIVALTRFDALGGSLGFIPFGLTTPEMAAVMGALGARDAVMLDGGISGQMMLREQTGKLRSWRGSRAVPLALVAVPR